MKKEEAERSCDNTYCIYQENNACLLDRISVNGIGQCLDCILVTIDPDTLEKMKRIQRERL